MNPTLNVHATLTVHDIPVLAHLTFKTRKISTVSGTGFG